MRGGFSLKCDGVLGDGIKLRIEMHLHPVSESVLLNQYEMKVCSRWTNVACREGVHKALR